MPQFAPVIEILNSAGSKIGAAWKRLAVPLWMACLLSVAFVAIVGLLIAFMQYQGRLLRAQPGLTAGQLVTYVETEAKIEKVLEELGKASQDISSMTLMYSHAQNEIEYRIDRICSLFNTGAESVVQVKRCSEFMKRIPFIVAAQTSQQIDVTATPSIAPSVVGPGPIVGPHEVPVNAAAPLSKDTLTSILDGFTLLMGGPNGLDSQLRILVQLYRSDFETIAERNQRFLLDLQPNYRFMFSKYLTECNYIDSLARTVTYRKVDIGLCRQYFEQYSNFYFSPTPQFGTSPVVSINGDFAQIKSPFEQEVLQKAPQPATFDTGATLSAATPDRIASPRKETPSAGQEANDSASSPAIPTPQPEVNSASQRHLLGTGVAVPRGGEISQQRASSSESDQQRDFELVTHYRFYDNLSRGMLKDILMSPSEFLALLLVCFSGILGALLRVVFSAYITGRNPDTRSVLIGPILGLICALVVYVLFRAGFIAITDRPENANSTTLSPFVIAFISMTAGLLSERAIEFFRKTGGGWLGNVEASQSARWAVRLGSVLAASGLTSEVLAARIGVSKEKIEAWTNEEEPVPIDMQRAVSLVLGVSSREIFTDLDPVVV